MLAISHVKADLASMILGGRVAYSSNAAPFIPVPADMVRSLVGSFDIRIVEVFTRGASNLGSVLGI